MVNDIRIIEILNDDIAQDENAAYLKNYIDVVTTQLETLKYKIKNIYYLEDIENLKDIVKQFEKEI